MKDVAVVVSSVKAHCKILELFIHFSTVVDVLTKLDKNGDGFISESEVLASVWKILALYDLNSKYHDIRKQNKLELHTGRCTLIYV